MINFALRGDVIELYKLLKASGLCENGGMAKHAIAEGLVTVDGNVEKRKACQIRAGQKVGYDGKTIIVEKEKEGVE